MRLSDITEFILGQNLDFRTDRTCPQSEWWAWWYFQMLLPYCVWFSEVQAVPVLICMAPWTAGPSSPREEWRAMPAPSQLPVRGRSALAWDRRIWFTSEAYSVLYLFSAFICRVGVLNKQTHAMGKGYRSSAIQPKGGFVQCHPPGR